MGKEGEFVIRPKSRGSSIRVSGFVDESNGYLRLTDKECERVRAKDPTHAFLGIMEKAEMGIGIGTNSSLNYMKL